MRTAGNCPENIWQVKRELSARLPEAEIVSAGLGTELGTCLGMIWALIQTLSMSIREQG
jgi:hypothetical protein